MLAEDFEKSIKIIIVGNGTVGKSSLILRFCNGEFTVGYKKTIGVDFVEKVALIPTEDGSEEKLTFLLWDTAGQEEFDSMTRSYYRGADAALIVFSVTDRASFEAIPKWHTKSSPSHVLVSDGLSKEENHLHSMDRKPLQKVVEECGDVLTVVVQNKVDLMDQATVTPADVDTLREKLNVRIFRTSVKDNLNVDEVFEYIATNHLRILRGSPHAGETPPKGQQNVYPSLADSRLPQTEVPKSDNFSQPIRVTLTRPSAVPAHGTKQKFSFFRRTLSGCVPDQM